MLVDNGFLTLREPYITLLWIPSHYLRLWVHRLVGLCIGGSRLFGTQPIKHVIILCGSSYKFQLGYGCRFSPDLSTSLARVGAERWKKQSAHSESAESVYAIFTETSFNRVSSFFRIFLCAEEHDIFLSLTQQRYAATEKRGKHWSEVHWYVSR